MKVVFMLIANMIFQFKSHTATLDSLGNDNSQCNCLLDFLTGRTQVVWVGSKTSSTITVNKGASQWCVLRSLLFTLLTHNCTLMQRYNLFNKFADDTTVGGTSTK